MENNEKRYYLNNGKLDLTLLDENPIMSEDEMMMNFEHLFTDITFEIDEEESPKEDENLKISQETYNTLKELGEFFTKNNS